MNDFDPKKDCCPPFDPIAWDGKIVEWENKKFIKGKVFTFFYMPVNFGAVITKMNQLVEKAGGQTPDYLCLSDHKSKWNMDIYLAVDKEIPEADNVILNGKYLSKVFEGNLKETGKWCVEFESYRQEKGYAEIQKIYMWYTTCPKCAKKYGKNNVVIIGQIS